MTAESDFTGLFIEILPKCLAPILVLTTLSFANAILAEASLSFLGVGFPPPAPSWGLMLSEARQFMETAPYMAIFPGLAIFLYILGFNLLGDGLRDIFDPRQYIVRIRDASTQGRESLVSWINSSGKRVTVIDGKK